MTKKIINPIVTVGIIAMLFNYSSINVHAEWVKGEKPGDVACEPGYEYGGKYNPNSNPLPGNGGNGWTADNLPNSSQGTITESENIPSETPTTEPIEEQPKHQHSYSADMTTSPTCTEEGVLTYTCSCGDSYTEPVEATGHDYKEEITKEPTCELDGEKTFTCTLCNDTYTEVIKATGHEEIATTKEKQPTCTETGIQNYSCKVCHKTLRQEEIPATGHTEGEEETVKEPTLISKGQKEVRCMECNEVLETETINIPTTYLVIDIIIVAVVIISVLLGRYLSKKKNS